MANRGSACYSILLLGIVFEGLRGKKFPNFSMTRCFFLFRTINIYIFRFLIYAICRWLWRKKSQRGFQSWRNGSLWAHLGPPVFRSVIIFRQMYAHSDVSRIANTAHARRAQTKSTTRCKRVVSTAGRLRCIARWTLSDETLIALISFFFFNISAPRHVFGAPSFSPVFVNKFPFFLFFFNLDKISNTTRLLETINISRMLYIFFLFFSFEKRKILSKKGNVGFAPIKLDDFILLALNCYAEYFAYEFFDECKIYIQIFF